MGAAALSHDEADFLPGCTAGLVLFDAQNRMVYHNSHALGILTFAGAGEKAEFLYPAIEALLSARTQKNTNCRQDFRSGRRLYTCRWFVLSHSSGNPQQDVTGVLLERSVAPRVDLAAAARQFGLTQREQQTVEFLTLGLTSKEIASRMNISPNTVKVFFRMVMMKMAVNTRSGILGKITQTQTAA